MKNLYKILLIWGIMGMMYLSLESIWRGWTHFSMIIIGGLCGVCIGYINQIPKFYNMKIIYQSLIGTFIALIVEFISGIILNKWLGLNIWDYSNEAFNIMGQVCPQYGLLWFIMMPLIIWVEDRIRYLFKWGNDNYTLLSIYKDLFTFK